MCSFSNTEVILCNDENAMTKQHQTQDLIRALRDLYFKFSEFELVKRVNGYRRNLGSNKAPDIGYTLTAQIDKLAAENKQRVNSVNQIEAVKEFSETKNSHHMINAPFPSAKNELTNLSRSETISPYRSKSDEYMGDKLKASTWSHIHMALMQARNGEVSTAKLHADIANQALKEAAHFMDEAAYKDLCIDIEKALSEQGDTRITQH